MSTLAEPRVSRRGFWVTGVVVSLLIAAVLSFYASSHPDGLEFVADRTGFIEQAEDSATSDSPLADYGVEGVGNERLSTGLAGVAGSLVVLGLAGGLALLLRRRDEPDEA
ncbi:PDGLE domain-containing protein [Nocardioides sp.]|uniref:PDGLE domain-containing protein n=1 Tax=Nocardioides sp. TaxID=35761 RepID=UPI00273426C6|nr:PDGLE domain-containing protein [Nocardioides sp.]MDP3894687.1 PDGLE domain-containing protein [Nocardioides sp.]